MTPVDIYDIYDYCQAADLERFFDAVIARDKAIEVKRQRKIKNHWRSRLARLFLSLAKWINHPENKQRQGK